MKREHLGFGELLETASLHTGVRTHIKALHLHNRGDFPESGEDPEGFAPSTRVHVCAFVSYLFLMCAPALRSSHVFIP